MMALDGEGVSDKIRLWIRFTAWMILLLEDWFELDEEESDADEVVVVMHLSPGGQRLLARSAE